MNLGLLATLLVAAADADALEASCAANGAPGFSRLVVAGERPARELTICARGGAFDGDDFLIEGTHNTYLRGLIGARFQPLSWLGAYSSVSFARNENSLLSPGVLSVRGDLEVGALATKHLGPLAVLGLVAVDVPAAIEGEPSSGPVVGGVALAGVSWTALHIHDTRLRLHANAGYQLDNTAALVGRRAVTPLSAFALGIEHYDKVLARAGIEGARGPLSAYVIAEGALPVGAEGTSPLPTLRIVPGVRWAAHRTVSVDATVELGFGGGSEGTAAPAPWLAGVAVAWSPSLFAEVIAPPVSAPERPVPVPEAPPPAAAPAMGWVSITVVDVEDESNTALAGSELRLRGLTTAEEGRYDGKGSWSLELKPGRYQLEAEAPGYLLRGRALEVRAGERHTLEIALRKISKPVAALERSRIAISETLHFDVGRVSIRQESFFILDQVASILLRNRHLRIRIEGHTDNVGDATFNAALSNGRAEAVRTYLIEAGVESERLTAEGFGPARPIAENTTEAGRARNRRVEFVVIENEAR